MTKTARPCRGGKLRSFGLVALPHPNQGVGERCVEDRLVAVIRGAAEHVPVIVALSGQLLGGAFVRHDPVVIRILGVFVAEVVLGDVRKDAQRFLFAVADQVHAAVIFPRAERIFGFVGCVVVLLVDECSRIRDQSAKQVGTKPADRQRRRPTAAASHDGFSPGVSGKRNSWEDGFDFGIGQHRGQDLIVDESCVPVGHGVVLQSALAALAIVTAVLDRNRDERGQAAVGIIGDGQVVQRIADEIESAGTIKANLNRGLIAILIGVRHVDKNLAFRANGLCGVERRVGSRKNFAVRQRHREHEIFTLGISKVSQLRLNRVVGADDKIALDDWLAG